MNYDLIVIGGGSGGIRAARWSAQQGAKVAVCESDRLGGTCVIRGCVPKKLMVYGSEFSHHFNHASSYGWELNKPKLNWDIFNTKRNEEIKRLEGIYSKLLTNNKVELLKGKASLKDKNTVEVEGRTYTSRYILIATGGWPHFLSLPGNEFCISSNDVFSLKEKPRSLIVIGSGYIGLEFASIFQSLGTQVTLLYRRDFVLRGFDLDIRKKLQEEIAKKGVTMMSGRSPLTIEKSDTQFKVQDDKGGTYTADQVLMATGRIPNTKGLNLKKVGVHTNGKREIVVDKDFKTSISNIFAIGDCASTPYQLTPVATTEGMIVSESLFSKDPMRSIKYENIPTAIFTQPPAGTVGLSEEDALTKGYKVTIFESHFRPLKLTLTDDQEKTYMKLVVEQKTDKVLGCHLVGEGAGEIIQGFAVALNGGLTKQVFDQTIGVHPSSAEEFVTMRTPRKT